jgi:YegS/Rv2252/BmrU family lipid kinase
VDPSIHIIINPISGGASPAVAEERAALAQRVCAAAGESAVVAVTDRRGHARELARRAVGSGARLVIAWGGDGTNNEVAQALISTATALGIVRGGSGNGLARELHVSRTPERAIADAIAAQPRRIDVGELGGRLFVNVAGIGLDARIAARFDERFDERLRRGLAGYARVSARELWSYTPASYRIDGSSQRARPALLVTFANSAQFGNGARIAPHARIDDGLLDLVIFEETSRLATLWGFPRLFTGGIARLRGISTRQITEATVEADAPMMFHVDGEPVQGGTKLEARVRPGALLIAAPR